jgi:hypothetical protein
VGFAAAKQVGCISGPALPIATLRVDGRFIITSTPDDDDEREPTALWPMRGPRFSSGHSGKQINGSEESPPGAFAVERVTRIELAWPAWKTKPVRLWLGTFLTCKGKG